jgi:ferric-dicitrate binding protein FerR (iron transport regulator)
MPAISEELLAKFLRGLCTEEEAAIVEEYFQQHPEDVSMLDEYESNDGSLKLPEGYQEEMLTVILAETASPVEKSRNRVMVMRVWMAAACTLLLVTGWWLLQQTPARKKGTMAIRLASVWIGKHNADNKKLRVQLPDSSETILSPGATIRYRKDFGQYGEREVQVEGEAVFTVIKDKDIPFVVYCEGVRTTVMGTIFEVSAEKGSSQVRIRLVEGKLVLKLDSIARDTIQSYVLTPGKEFIYGKWDRSVVIREFDSHSSGSYSLSRLKRLPGGPDSLANWYMFNNQALTDVFDQLSVLYNVDIQYSSEDLRNKYFIGKLERKDSLSKTMRDIALLNHLTVSIIDGHYVVRKQKP